MSERAESDAPEAGSLLAALLLEQQQRATRPAPTDDLRTLVEKEMKRSGQTLPRQIALFNSESLSSPTVWPLLLQGDGGDLAVVALHGFIAAQFGSVQPHLAEHATALTTTLALLLSLCTKAKVGDFHFWTVATPLLQVLSEQLGYLHGKKESARLHLNGESQKQLLAVARTQPCWTKITTEANKLAAAQAGRKKPAASTPKKDAKRDRDDSD